MKGNKLKYGVLYCFWNNQNVIKEAEVIEARNIESAFEKTNRNKKRREISNKNETTKYI
ncbi:hypothetical protein HYW99_02765 [Candidatus Woesearchaeota archaeon]|nr:hypothetical protein [Candidatus Woesearchaeota archaeon]